LKTEKLLFDAKLKEKIAKVISESAVNDEKNNLYLDDKLSESQEQKES
jgi:hypothetical protein